ARPPARRRDRRRRCGRAHRRMRARDRQGPQGRRHLGGDPRVSDALAGRAALRRRAPQRGDARGASARTPDARVAARRLIVIARALAVALGVAALVAFFAFDVDEHRTLEAFAAHRDALIRFADTYRPAALALAFGFYALGVALCLPAGLVFALACG